MRVQCSRTCGAQCTAVVAMCLPGSAVNGGCLRSLDAVEAGLVKVAGVQFGDHHSHLLHAQRARQLNKSLVVTGGGRRGQLSRWGRHTQGGQEGSCPACMLSAACTRLQRHAAATRQPAPNRLPSCPCRMPCQQRPPVHARASGRHQLRCRGQQAQTQLQSRRGSRPQSAVQHPPGHREDRSNVCEERRTCGHACFIHCMRARSNTLPLKPVSQPHTACTRRAAPRHAPTCAAPVIMLGTKSRWPGASSSVTLRAAVSNLPGVVAGRPTGVLETWLDPLAMLQRSCS